MRGRDMRIGSFIFASVVGSLIVLINGRYSYRTADNEFDAWCVAILFGAISVAALAGHSLAVRLWKTNIIASLFIALVCTVALLISLSRLSSRPSERLRL